jgi:hypothetical protein
VPIQLHVANSMSIRYVNVLGGDISDAEVFSNRGTSGIDGCVSTAIGAAMVNQKPTFLIVGDVAFLYDRNGLLINELPQNLKIVVINNAGGNIFRMIDGPTGYLSWKIILNTTFIYCPPNVRGIRAFIISVSMNLILWRNAWLICSESGAKPDRSFHRSLRQ